MTSLRATVLKGTTVIAISNVISRFAAFFSVVLVTRGLSLFDYGVIALVISLMGPFTALSSFGMDDLVVADASRAFGEGRRDRAKTIVVGFFSIQSVILTVLLVLGWLFRNTLAMRYGPAILDYFRIFAILVAAQYVRSSFNIIFNIHQRFNHVALLNAIEPMARCGVIVLLWLNNALSIGSVLLGYAIAAMVAVLVTAPALLKTIWYFRTTRGTTEPLIKMTLKQHGKWQMLLDVISNMATTLKYWLIKIILSTEAVAIFSVAQSMFSAVAALIPLKSVVFPIISASSNNPALQQAIVKRVTKYAFLLGLGAFFGILLFAPFLVITFFPKYSASIIIFEMMSFRLLLNAFSVAQAPLFVALREQKFLSIIAIKNIISVLVFSPPLMFFFGLPGAVIEGFIPVILSIIWREQLLRKKYGFSSFDIRHAFTIDDFDRKLIREIWQRLPIVGRN